MLSSDNSGRRTAGILSKGYVLIHVSTLCLAIVVRGPEDEADRVGSQEILTDSGR